MSRPLTPPVVPSGQARCPLCGRPWTPDPRNTYCLLCELELWQETATSEDWQTPEQHYNGE